MSAAATGQREHKAGTCPTCGLRRPRHDRPPCFVCEAREAAPGQLLCSVCIAWAVVGRA